MDANQFDSLAKSLGEHASRRVIAGGLAGGMVASLLDLLGLPGVEAARKKKRKRRAREKSRETLEAEKKRKKRKKKVTLCHDGRTIKVKKKKRKKHLRHGDTLGACPTVPPAPPPPPPPPPPAPGPCIPAPNPCGSRQCGTVINSCGDEVACGANNGGCPGTNFCHDRTGQCLPESCRACGDDECCDAAGICQTANTGQNCGYGGGACEVCNEGVDCVNGVCTCRHIGSCNPNCCTTVNGKPACDRSSVPCGNTCIPKEQCCTGTDASSYQSIQPGCRPNERCVAPGQPGNTTAFGQCLCGSSRCRHNQGCCTLDASNQSTCNVALRPCGGTCIAKEQCCSEGQATAVGAECEDGVQCTSVTCQTHTGSGTTLGICTYNETAGACPQACLDGYGYGNQFPEFQREVRCGSVNGQRCYCWRTTEGDNRCTYEFAGAPACRSSSECGANEVCMRSGLVTGANRCARICG